MHLYNHGDARRLGGMVSVGGQNLVQIVNAFVHFWTKLSSNRIPLICKNVPRKIMWSIRKSKSRCLLFVLTTCNNLCFHKSNFLNSYSIYVTKLRLIGNRVFRFDIALERLRSFWMLVSRLRNETQTTWSSCKMAATKKSECYVFVHCIYCRYD